MLSVFYFLPFFQRSSPERNVLKWPQHIVVVVAAAHNDGTGKSKLPSTLSLTICSLFIG